MKRRILLVLLCMSLVLPIFGVSAEETQPTEAVAQTEPTEVTVPETTQATVPQETTAPTEPTEATEPSETEPEEGDDAVLQNLLSQLGGKPANEDQRLRQQIMRIHSKTLQETGLDTLSGKCGLQVAWQLYLLGIDKYLVSNNGNDHYDYYKNAGATSAGYPIRTYDVQEHSLEQALNLVSRNGTRNAYNILVGFEKTNTEAGQQFGHAIFIHAIYNGKIYCTEGYASRFGTQEGEPIVISIRQFVDWVSSWTQYEGLIYFGKGDPMDSYISYACDLFVQSDVPQQLLTEPEAGEVLRTVEPGERLRVTGLFEDLAGVFYYRVSDDGGKAYVAAEAFYPVRFNYEDVTCEKPVLPEKLKEKANFKSGGQITTGNLRMESITVRVTDAQGATAFEGAAEKDCTKLDMSSSQVRKVVKLRDLPVGAYVYRVWANCVQDYLQDGVVVSEKQPVCVAAASFTVGEAELPASLATVSGQETGDGWNYIGGKWYYYENGAPRTGWYGNQGQSYYFDETGAAVTGWVEINGQMRYFGDTGALRRGFWLTDAGTKYFLRNGIGITGWRTIEDQRYYFDESGIMLANLWKEMDGKLYYFCPDGKAAADWIEVDGIPYHFHPEGYLLAKKVVNGEEEQVIDYDGTWKP